MKNNSTLMIWIFFALVLGLIQTVHGSIVANDLTDPYPGGNKMIEANVTDGAAFFFQAFTDGLNDMIKHLQTMRDKLAVNIQPTIYDFWYLLNRSYYFDLFGKYGTVGGR